MVNKDSQKDSGVADDINRSHLLMSA